MSDHPDPGQAALSSDGPWFVILPDGSIGRVCKAEERTAEDDEAGTALPTPKDEGQGAA